jgi:squalene-hopene/tetraprenyl-beta-curcumene cyclase
MAPTTVLNTARVRQVSLALEFGTRFLLAMQGSDGLWRDFLTPAGEASEWPTGFVATALHLAGADASALERAADALVARQNDDGGWGYNEEVPSDTDSTACVLLFLALTGRRWSACARAASCLVRHQRRDDGGLATYGEPGPIRRFMGVGRWWRFDGWCSSQTEVTATAGLALSAIGRRAEADAAWRYVRSRQHDDGSWSSYWWTSPHYATQQAVELAVSFGDRDAVGRAAGWVLRTVGLDAPAFPTALSLSVLLNAGASGEAVEHAIARLAAMQDDDGGWPSHPIMRIPLPGDTDPDRRRLVRIGRGIIVRDQHRTFTSAACIAALTRARMH